MKPISCNNEMTVKNHAALPECWMIRSSFNTLSNTNMSGERLFFVFPVLSNLYESTGFLPELKNRQVFAE